MAAKIFAYRETIEKALNEDTPLSKPFEWAEKKTGVKRLYLFLGLVTFLAFYLVFGYGAQLICNMIGFLYPAYASLKALETPNKEDDTQWLTYWTVFGFFSICEFFSDILLSWFPFYWLAKCLFLVWCCSSLQMNGSYVVYNRIIRPIFLKHGAEIDKAGDKLVEISDLVAKAAESALKKGL